MTPKFFFRRKSPLIEGYAPPVSDTGGNGEDDAVDEYAGALVVLRPNAKSICCP
jgi:hypothetical protein